MVQSVMRSGGAIRAVCFGAVAASMLSGCGLSSVTSGLGTSIMGGSSTSAEASSVNEQELLAAAKASGGDIQTAGFSASDSSPGCPRFTVWPRDSHLTIYEAGRVGDGLAIVHR